MSPLDLVEREEDIDGLRLRLPAPHTPWRALGRLGLVIGFGVSGFTFGAVLGAVLGVALGLGPALALLGFAGMWLGLLGADKVSASVLPILAPVYITLGSHHMEVRHRNDVDRLALSEIADLDGARHQLITRDGRRIAVAPQQPMIVRDWVLMQVSAWVAARLDEQGCAEDVPPALRALKARE